MVIAYYQIMLLMSIALTLLYIVSWHKHFDVHITLIFTLMPLTIAGNLLLSVSENAEEAVIANKLVYFGGTFLILFITLSILGLCDIRLPKPIVFCMFLCSIVIYMSVLSIGKYDWFYRSYEFLKQEGGSILVNKQYGVMHTVFSVMIILYFATALMALIYSYFFKKSVSKKIIILLFLPEMIAVFAFYGGKALFNGRVELLPGAYVFAQIMYLIIIHQVCLYDITESGIDSIVQTGDKGFLSFDFKRHYLGCNETARGIFPELASVNVDTVIPDSNPIAKYVNTWLDAFIADDKNNSFHYQSGDSIQLISVTYLYDGRRKRGYQFFISDDTRRQQYVKLLNNFNTQLKEQVAEKTQHIVEMHNKLILGMATMVESRDNSTGGHIRRTSECVRMLTDEIRRENTLKLEDEYIANLIKAAPMHDLGKIAVDDAVLRKPGRFEPWEFEKMKAHAREGARIVHEILQGTDDEAFHHVAENMAHYHHERWDGSGYPDGLAGEAIPLEARIMAIADVYDALVSKRVYKDSMSFEKADRIIMEGMGTQFDPSLERYYVVARPHFEEYYKNQSDAAIKKEGDICS